MQALRIPIHRSRTIARLRQSYENKRWDLICVGVSMPLMVLLIIPAAANAWQRDAHDQHIKVSKPADVIVLMSVSAVLALVANATLYIRLKTPEFPAWINKVTIIASVVRVILSIAAYIVYALFHDSGLPASRVQYSGEYIMGIVDTSLSSIISLLLIYDYYHAREAQHPGTSLTRQEFMLVRAVTWLFAWWAISSVVYMYLEDWTYLDAVYFWLGKRRASHAAVDAGPNAHVVSVATIGFGEYRPTYLGSRLVWIVFQAVGIGLLARMINAYVIVVFENIQRHTEQRIQALRRMRRQSRHRDEMLQTDLNGAEESGSEDEGTLAEDIGQTVADARKEKSVEQGKEVIQKVTFAGILLMSCWLFGALTFSLTEGWDFGTSFYFCFVALTTTGFGDIVLRSAAGIVLFIFFCLLGLGCMAYFGSVLVQLRLWILRYAIRRAAFHLGQLCEHALRGCRRLIRRIVWWRGAAAARGAVDVATGMSTMPTARTLRRFLPTALTAATFTGTMASEENVLPISEREAVVEEILDATRKLNQLVNQLGRFPVDPRPVTVQRELSRFPSLLSAEASPSSPMPPADESPEPMATPPSPPPPPPSTPRLLLEERRRRALRHPPSAAAREETANLTVLEGLPVWRECQQHMHAITRATIRLLDIERDATS
ncbi:hypothetical protein SYNPS1DRAFT_28749 [Syncephalis pseudoplumigaleata]|uniref:Potassium channel domain-containing protein n=1 Tax=Syncephalis pseudoplumigaleata TaxID=1712513 RepID=A0A4P9Z247_9FUNG|nr:hypothetical protein SYNPS1DRAFT_28749 [Syncephalis pseudoplumigaleata]|eukprot:RKP25520.1 hypothetical protein SYNPS1DRAFT_28749 [Syncephalis pseudoplumigaleata]